MDKRSIRGLWFLGWTLLDRRELTGERNLSLSEGQTKRTSCFPFTRQLLLLHSFLLSPRIQSVWRGWEAIGMGENAIGIGIGMASSSERRRRKENPNGTSPTKCRVNEREQDAMLKGAKVTYSTHTTVLFEVLPLLSKSYTSSERL